MAQIREENNNTFVSRTFEKNNANVPIPNPVQKFEHCFKEYPDMMQQIAKAGFTKPSPIQAQAWPILLKGDDMIGVVNILIIVFI